MHILIIGATSDIARAVARAFASLGDVGFTLTARDPAALADDAKDLEIRCGRNAELVELDLASRDSVDRFTSRMDLTPDVVIVAAGAMHVQQDAQKDASLLRNMIEVNYTGPAVIIEAMVSRMVERGSGTIIGISSVAGDRGRASNYLYGASKGALTAYLSGLRNRVFKRGVQIITVLPGFVRTRMTAGMELPEKLLAEPNQVANDVLKAFQKKKDVVYTIWPWRWIMLVIRSLPEAIFKRTSL